MMIKSVAEQLVLAVMGYREGPAVRPRAVEGNGGWLVRTSRGQYAEVPERLELSEHACRCTARWCASGKVAPGLLDRIRSGEKVF